MKKELISGFILMMLAINVNGQEAEQKLHFGLKFSPILSWTTSDIEGFDDDGSSIGFIYGLMTDFNFTPNYSFSTGLEISQRSGKKKSDEVSIKYNFQYIDIPVALKLSTNEIGYMTYYGKFGFMPGFNVKATRDIDYSDPSLDDEEDKKINSDINAFNVGVMVGAGLEYNIGGNTNIMAELLFHNGFIDVFKESNATLKTNYLALNLGVYF